MSARPGDQLIEEFWSWYGGRPAGQQGLPLRKLVETWAAESDLPIRHLKGVWQAIYRSPQAWHGHPPPDKRHRWVEFQEYVKATVPCLACGAHATDWAHFPRTDKRGGDHLDGLPLCRLHHQQLDLDGPRFTWDHRHTLWDWAQRIPGLFRQWEGMETVASSP